MSRCVLEAVLTLALYLQISKQWASASELWAVEQVVTQAGEYAVGQVVEQAVKQIVKQFVE